MLLTVKILDGALSIFTVMSMNDKHINYIEFRAKDLNAIKAFYSAAFDWKFVDYGPHYVAFSNSGLEGGFELTEDEIVNGVLVVLYHSDLDAIKARVLEAGGTILLDIFSFPGGHRFEFADPSGNALAVWSDQYTA